MRVLLAQGDHLNAGAVVLRLCDQLVRAQRRANKLFQQLHITPQDQQGQQGGKGSTSAVIDIGEEADENEVEGQQLHNEAQYQQEMHQQGVDPASIPFASSSSSHPTRSPSNKAKPLSHHEAKAVLTSMGADPQGRIATGLKGEDWTTLITALVVSNNVQHAFELMDSMRLLWRVDNVDDVESYASMQLVQAGYNDIALHVFMRRFPGSTPIDENLAVVFAQFAVQGQGSFTLPLQLLDAYLMRSTSARVPIHWPFAQTIRAAARVGAIEEALALFRAARAHAVRPLTKEYYLAAIRAPTIPPTASKNARLHALCTPPVDALPVPNGRRAFYSEQFLLNSERDKMTANHANMIPAPVGDAGIEVYNAILEGLADHGRTDEALFLFEVLLQHKLALAPSHWNSVKDHRSAYHVDVPRSISSEVKSVSLVPVSNIPDMDGNTIALIMRACTNTGRWVDALRIITVVDLGLDHLPPPPGQEEPLHQADMYYQPSLDAATITASNSLVGVVHSDLSYSKLKRAEVTGELPEGWLRNHPLMQPPSKFRGSVWLQEVTARWLYAQRLPHLADEVLRDPDVVREELANPDARPPAPRTHLPHFSSPHVGLVPGMGPIYAAPGSPTLSAPFIESTRARKNPFITITRSAQYLYLAIVAASQDKNLPLALSLLSDLKRQFISNRLRMAEVAGFLRRNDKPTELPGIFPTPPPSTVISILTTDSVPPNEAAKLNHQGAFRDKRYVLRDTPRNNLSHLSPNVRESIRTFGDVFRVSGVSSQSGPKNYDTFMNELEASQVHYSHWTDLQKMEETLAAAAAIVSTMCMEVGNTDFAIAVSNMCKSLLYPAIQYGKRMAAPRGLDIPPISSTVNPANLKRTPNRHELLTAVLASRPPPAQYMADALVVVLATGVRAHSVHGNVSEGMDDLIYLHDVVQYSTDLAIRPHLRSPVLPKVIPSQWQDAATAGISPHYFRLPNLTGPIDACVSKPLEPETTWRLWREAHADIILATGRFKSTSLSRTTETVKRMKESALRFASLIDSRFNAGVLAPLREASLPLRDESKKNAYLSSMNNRSNKPLQSLFWNNTNTIALSPESENIVSSLKAEELEAAQAATAAWEAAHAHAHQIVDFSFVHGLQPDLLVRTCAMLIATTDEKSVATHWRQILELSLGPSGMQSSLGARVPVADIPATSTSTSTTTPTPTPASTSSSSSSSSSTSLKPEKASKSSKSAKTEEPVPPVLKPVPVDNSSQLLYDTKTGAVIEKGLWYRDVSTTKPSEANSSSSFISASPEDVLNLNPYYAASVEQPRHPHLEQQQQQQQHEATASQNVSIERSSFDEVFSITSPSDWPEIQMLRAPSSEFERCTKAAAAFVHAAANRSSLMRPRRPDMFPEYKTFQALAQAAPKLFALNREMMMSEPFNFGISTMTEIAAMEAAGANRDSEGVIRHLRSLIQAYAVETAIKDGKTWSTEHVTTNDKCSSLLMPSDCRTFPSDMECALLMLRHSTRNPLDPSFSLDMHPSTPPAVSAAAEADSATTPPSSSSSSSSSLASAAADPKLRFGPLLSWRDDLSSAAVAVDTALAATVLGESVLSRLGAHDVTVGATSPAHALAASAAASRLYPLPERRPLDAHYILSGRFNRSMSFVFLRCTIILELMGDFVTIAKLAKWIAHLTTLVNKRLPANQNGINRYITERMSNAANKTVRGIANGTSLDERKNLEQAGWSCVPKSMFMTYYPQDVFTVHPSSPLVNEIVEQEKTKSTATEEKSSSASSATKQKANYSQLAVQQSPSALAAASILSMPAVKLSPAQRADIAVPSTILSPLAAYKSSVPLSVDHFRVIEALARYHFLRSKGAVVSTAAGFETELFTTQQITSSNTDPSTSTTSTTSSSASTTTGASSGSNKIDPAVAAEELKAAKLTYMSGVRAGIFSWLLPTTGAREWSYQYRNFLPDSLVFELHGYYPEVAVLAVTCLLDELFKTYQTMVANHSHGAGSPHHGLGGGGGIGGIGGMSSSDSLQAKLKAALGTVSAVTEVKKTVHRPKNTSTSSFSSASASSKPKTVTITKLRDAKIGRSEDVAAKIAAAAAHDNLTCTPIGKANNHAVSAYHSITNRIDYPEALLNTVVTGGICFNVGMGFSLRTTIANLFMNMKNPSLTVSLMINHDNGLPNGGVLFVSGHSLVHYLEERYKIEMGVDPPYSGIFFPQLAGEAMHHSAKSLADQIRDLDERRGAVVDNELSIEHADFMKTYRKYQSDNMMMESEDMDEIVDIDHN